MTNNAGVVHIQMRTLTMRSNIAHLQLLCGGGSWELNSMELKLKPGSLNAYPLLPWTSHGRSASVSLAGNYGILETIASSRTKHFLLIEYYPRLELLLITLYSPGPLSGFWCNYCFLYRPLLMNEFPFSLKKQKTKNKRKETKIWNRSKNVEITLQRDSAISPQRVTRVRGGLKKKKTLLYPQKIAFWDWQ